MSELSLNGNTLCIKVASFEALIEEIKLLSNFTQLNIVKDGEGYVIARPLGFSERGRYADLYRAQDRNPFELHKPRRLPQKPKPKGGPKGPKGPGPTGGSPAAGVIVEQTYTEAKAA